MSSATKLLIFAGNTRLNSFSRKLAHVAAAMISASPGALGGLRSRSHLASLLSTRNAGSHPRLFP